MTVPLTVRLSTSRKDIHVTNQIRDLTFRSVAPGGFASCSIALDRPLSLQPDEIAAYSRLYVYDGATGTTVWEGRLEDPGRTAGNDGQVWDIVAMGPSAHAQDRTKALIYVDSGLDGWRKSSYGAKSGTVETGEQNDNDESLIFRVPQGQDVSNSPQYFVDAIYQRVRECGQKLGRVSCDWIDGQTSAAWEQAIMIRTNAGAGSTADSDTFSTTPGSMAAVVGGTGFTNGDNVADLRMRRVTTPATLGNDLSWVAFTRVAVRAMLLDETGADVLTYNLDTVLTYQVVRDLLGRLLTKFDGTNAAIDTTSTYAIDQLAYPDGVSPAQVLEDLMILDPAYYWAAWESSAATGLYRFEWSAWPTTVRYEADVTDGFDSPGSSDGQYNAVTVRWRGASGRIRSTRRTSTVAELTDAGLTREAFLDLGDEIGSSAAATQAGDRFLAENATPPNAGTLTVNRPILDTIAGRMTQPWQIRPGTLIRVRGVQARIDSLNASARDGVTVFRVIAVDYSQGSNTATLELDSYPRTVARALANRGRRLKTRRR